MNLYIGIDHGIYAVGEDFMASQESSMKRPVR